MNPSPPDIVGPSSRRGCRRRFWRPGPPAGVSGGPLIRTPGAARGPSRSPRTTPANQQKRNWWVWPRIQRSTSAGGKKRSQSPNRLLPSALPIPHDTLGSQGALCFGRPIDMNSRSCSGSVSVSAHNTCQWGLRVQGYIYIYTGLGFRVSGVECRVPHTAPYSCMPK